MARAKKLPSGNWRAYVYAGKDTAGNRKYESFTAGTEDEANFLAAEFKLKHKKKSDAERLTFQEASDHYLKSKSNLLSPSTIRGYRIMQRNSFTLIAVKTLADIRDDDILQQQMNANAAKYSAKSLQNQFGFVSAVMSYYKMPIEKVTLKPPESKKISVPTKKDAEKILSILSKYPKVECYILLALTCSLRQSEIAGINAEDVHGDRIGIHGAWVPNEKNKWVYKPTPKSKAGTRTIKMSKYLSEKVNGLCKEIGHGRLFTFSESWVWKMFSRMLKENGLPHYSVHAMRHCFAAIMHARGVPDKYIKEMGGWSTDHVLKDVYQYTFDEETDKAKDAANDYFDKAMHHEKHHGSDK